MHKDQGFSTPSCLRRHGEGTTDAHMDATVDVMHTYKQLASNACFKVKVKSAIAHSQLRAN